MANGKKGQIHFADGLSYEIVKRKDGILQVVRHCFIVLWYNKIIEIGFYLTEFSVSLMHCFCHCTSSHLQAETSQQRMVMRIFNMK